MPYQVSVGSQVVEFPDSVSQEEAQKILADKFPPTGEDIANALQDPNFTPTQEQYQLFEDYNKTRQTDWLQSLLTAADTVVQTAGAAGKAAVTTGAAFNPKNYVEGLAQGTAQLYGLVAQSQDPDSALFKLNNLISGTGTLENRYGQFLEARQFNKDLDAYAKGDMSIMFKPEDLNPEFVQGVAMVADPTMFVPGVGQLLGAEKMAAKAVGKAVGVAGKGVQAISKPVERLSAATGRFVTEATGISPEALRGAATTSGVLAATGVGPAIGAVGAVPFLAEAATDVGRALESAGAQMGRAPTRIGALEAVGAIPEANMRQRIIGTIGRYGGDAALRTALAGTAGTLEGAALGGVLGYLSGGEEGAASGIGSGGVAGALGSLGARGLQTLTGSEAKAARLNDLKTYIETLTPEKRAAYKVVQERFGTDTAANLMDLESLIKGTRGDIGVEILRGDEFEKRAGVTARGVVPDENAATPRILINVDAMPKVKGDSPIYTLGHELLHALAKTKQFQGDVTGFIETLTGAYVPNPDGTMRLVSEGQYSPAKVEQLFNDYVKQLPADARANVISANPTASDRAVYVGEELAAEQVGRILSSQKPDAFLRGFGSTRQNFTDMLLLQEASRVGSKIGQLIERTFGITPTDSVLFPEIKNASPALDAALRRLLKARENIDEALLNADYQKSFKIDQKAISDPVAADYAVRGGFAERLPNGEVRLLTNGELLQRETRDVTALKQIIDGLPGAKIDINGEVVGDLSPEQLEAIKGSSVSSQMKQRLEMTNRSINEGRSLFVEYYPATEKVQDPTSKRWRTKYASRRVTFREVLPYNLLLSKENNSYVRAIDLTQVRKSLQRSIRPDGSVGGLWNNVGEFLGELNAYLSNLDRKENAIPSRKIFGPDKAEFFGDFMNSLEKGGSEFIHSFRLDRMGQMDPSDFRAKFSESAYKKMKDRFMPAGSVGEEQAWKSGAGFTILTSGNKFRLYGPEGKLLGIYDSAEQAQRKANATQTRLQPENDQLQYPTRNEVRQTTEAGNRNSSLDRTQGREEGRQANRQVRQAGDVGARFMPDQQGFYSKLEEVVSTKIPKSASPQQILATVDPAKGSGVKAEELKWTGFAQAVERIAKENGGKVPKEKLLEHLKNEGAVRFEEVTTGIEGKVITQEEVDRLERRAQRTQSNADWTAYEDAVQRFERQELGTEAQYSKYQLPGGSNYKEVVLTSNTAPFYTSSHFKDIHNYVAHMRSNERVDNSGKPGFFIEEIQSDRHQEARNKGYFEDITTDWSKIPVYEYRELVDKGIFPETIHIESSKSGYKLVSPDGTTLESSSSLESLKKNYERKVNFGTPDAPFRKDWSLQMFKRALRDAVAGGKEWIGWTTGDTQAKRYDLSKQIDRLVYFPDTESLKGYKNGKIVIDESGITKDQLPDYVGKEVATNLLSDKSLRSGAVPVHELIGQQLSVGGEGMIGFYDKILPSEIQKYVKQWGGRVEKGTLPERKGAVESIPPQALELRERYERGEQLTPEEEAIVFSPRKSTYRQAIPETPIWRVDITPQMRESIQKTGQPRFMPSDAEYLSAVQAGDTAKAQELVDQAAKAAGLGESRLNNAGNPEEMFHGSGWSAHNVFERGKSPSGKSKPYPGYGLDDIGFWFTSSKNQANEYGSVLQLEGGKRPPARLYNVFLDIKNPLEFSDHQEFNEWIESYAKTYAVDETSKKLMKGGRRLVGSLNVNMLLERLKMGKKDGIIIWKGNGDRRFGLQPNESYPTWAIVFDPSQIKSADPITRDDSGNIIPLSQRFQSTSPDIRYMPAPVPDPSIPGAYSMSGYRILPGKTKGKLRVYSPSGSLVGVVGSVDDAQRMIRKKLQ